MSHVTHVTHVTRHTYHCLLAVADGVKLEEEVNKSGLGEAFFKSVDISKEEEIKVCMVIRWSQTPALHCGTSTSS